MESWKLLIINAYDLKFISDADINYNPALGTGQIQIKDMPIMQIY